ncbi:alpha/beta hydrolase [Microbacterium sp. CFBP9034]|uniref:alpha/beta hydrolase n=1 Tax=Microbacterium sp. CFBP9034 TaxID=3096540 RepID=UPI002A6B34BE|nr:alpha/beta hydrolase [Microbacterium sp. CFBP9034]MDY0910138.1 alpha/beta hydrolase [Microbacterium sp. CFBP9034]
MVKFTRRGLTALAVAAAFSLVALAGATLPATAATTAEAHAVKQVGVATAAKPTIVLVHGAFADSSGWSLVSTALQAKGYPVIAFSNPLRGPLSDGEYLRQFLSTISGPLVLVGHSYGGAVITNAATGNPNVKSLVYIAAYALAEGESVQAANALGGGHTEVTDHLILRPFPGATAGDGDAYIDPAFFPQLFAQDLPKLVAQNMAGSQRPGALASLVTPSGPAAWESIPSWYMVASNDRIIPPEAERAMAARANAKTVEVKSSHVPMISQPLKVISLILDASK